MDLPYVHAQASSLFFLSETNQRQGREQEEQTLHKFLRKKKIFESFFQF